MYQVGMSKQTLSFRRRGIGMMGYSKIENTVESMAGNLYLRCFVFQTSDKDVLVYCNLEICFVTVAIRQAVITALAEDPETAHIKSESVILTAQHTHSAPGGYSHYMLYNVTVPGFQPQVFNTIVQTTIKGIKAALNETQPAVLKLGKGEFEPHLEVGFNRSLKAYNQNPEISKPLKDNETHLGINRNMDLLRIETPEGVPLGMLNWFGVHATSIGPDNQAISGDNKGFAARYFEQSCQNKYKTPACVGIFAQDAAADVSPNFYGTGKNWPRGKFDNDLESARFNGRLQANQAWEIFESSAKTTLSPKIDGDLFYSDFAQIQCDRKYTHTKEVQSTSAAAHGLAFLRGTADGKGVNDLVAKLLETLAKKLKQNELKRMKTLPEAEQESIRQKYSVQDPKHILIEGGRQLFLGQSNLNKLPVPEFIDPVIAELKRLQQNSAIKEHTWTPHILPVQIGILGELAIVALPGEISVIAARRLKATVLETLAPKGIQYVVLNSYANAYHGYITTPEEYAVQNYEGGHTVFGKWTLPAFQTQFAKLSASLLLPIGERSLDKTLKPPVFSEEELAKRTYTPS